jgi:hypothetical protein
LNRPPGAGHRSVAERGLEPCPLRTREPEARTRAAAPLPAALLLAALLPAPLLLARCASERYTRPAGPPPRYESAPLAPWANEAREGGRTSGDEAIESEIERALAADAGL